MYRRPTFEENPRPNATANRHCLLPTATAYCHCLLLLLLLTASFCTPALAQTLTICTEGAGYTLVSGADATGTSPVTYTWYENDVEAPNSNTPWIGIPAGKTPGVYEYVRKASNEECTDVPSNTWIVEVLQCYASTQTWTYGTQTWSDRIVADVTNCTKTQSLTTSNANATQYKVSGNRYYYTWTCAYNNRYLFCPSPWRLPTRDDFTALIGAVTNTTLVNDWGLGGNANGGSMYNTSYGYYWSSTEYSTISHAYLLNYSNNNTLSASNYHLKYNGFQVRCVK